MNTQTKKNKSRILEIGNGHICRVISVEDGVLQTVCIRNGFTGQEFRLQSEEFRLTLDGGKKMLTGKDFKVEDIQDQSDGKLRKVIFALKETKGAIRARVIYEISGDDFYVRKHLVVDVGRRLVNSVDVESFKSRNQFVAGGGFGQPVFFGREFFAGLEYPAGYNETGEQRQVCLTHYPGKRGEVESKRSVFGVCPDRENERLRKWFLKYIEQNRARTVKRFSILYNCPGGNAFMQEKDYKYYKDCYLRRGLAIDTVYIETGDSWVSPKSLMGEKPENKQKPSITLRKKWAAEHLGAGVMLHLNTAGGRWNADHKWFAKHFDMISEKYYCLADPRVRQGLLNNLLRLIDRYDVKGFSFDWLWWRTAWECGAANHRGHIEGVKYGREAITDSFIEIADALRQRKPDIYLIDLEVELSPWWLMHVDALWWYGAETRDFKAEHIDGLLYWWLKDAIYPMSSMWYTDCDWPYPERKGQYPAHALTDLYMMRYLRGTLAEELWHHPKTLTEDEKDAIAKVIQWGRSHDDILVNGSSRFILGDPLAGEVYGYSHFTEDNRGIVGIVNPRGHCDEKTRIILDEKIGFNRLEGGKYLARIVYPYEEVLAEYFKYGQTLECEVPAGGILVVELIPAAEARHPIVSGIRYIARKTPGGVSYDLLGACRGKKRVKILSDNDDLADITANIYWRGKKLVGKDFYAGTDAASSERVKVSAVSIRTPAACGGIALAGEMKIAIPDGRARLAVSVEIDLPGIYESWEKDKKIFSEKCDQALTLEIKNCRKSVRPATERNTWLLPVHIGKHPRKEASFRYHKKFFIPLCRANDLAFSLRIKEFKKAKIGIWVERKTALECLGTLEVNGKNAGFMEDAPYLPSIAKESREVIPVLETREFE